MRKLKVGDYSKEFGVSTQAIYKRIKRKTLKMELIDNVKFILVEDEEAPKKEKINTPEKGQSSGDDKEILSLYKKRVSELEKELDDYKKKADEKDRRLDKKQDEIDKLNHETKESYKIALGYKHLLEQRTPPTHSEKQDDDIYDGVLVEETGQEQEETKSKKKQKGEGKKGKKDKKKKESRWDKLTGKFKKKNKK